MSEWADLVKPHIDRFNIGAKFDQNVEFNSVGCAAMSELLETMARTLDQASEARNQALEEAAALVEEQAKSCGGHYGGGYPQAELTEAATAIRALIAPAGEG